MTEPLTPDEITDLVSCGVSNLPPVLERVEAIELRVADCIHAFRVMGVEAGRTSDAILQIGKLLLPVSDVQFDFIPDE